MDNKHELELLTERLRKLEQQLNANEMFAQQRLTRQRLNKQGHNKSYYQRNKETMKARASQRKLCEVCNKTYQIGKQKVHDRAKPHQTALANSLKEVAENENEQ